MGIFTIIVMAAILVICIALQSEFKKQTGVDMPSRSAAKGIRRRAKKKGVSEAQYLDEWIERKKRGKH